VTEFFVPFADRERAETIYSQLAGACRCAVPFMGERIREIHWTHNGDYWVATVGEKLHGRSVRLRRRKGGNVEVTTPITDPATVVAIFPGATYYVVTNAKPIGRSSLTGSIPSWLDTPQPSTASICRPPDGR
jgi:hypothetical protein